MDRFVIIRKDCGCKIRSTAECSRGDAFKAVKGLMDCGTFGDCAVYDRFTCKILGTFHYSNHTTKISRTELSTETAKAFNEFISTIRKLSAEDVKRYINCERETMKSLESEMKDTSDETCFTALKAALSIHKGNLSEFIGDLVLSGSEFDEII